ncbi:MAG: 4Fe-4S binding protein [Clostridia bacterium]|nr:4Fe-4S binding protein [Clostridia bacterium]
MKETKLKNRIFYITFLFFAAGIINISFSILGLFCFIYPFILFLKYKDRIWCRYFCPRSGFLSVVISKISFKLKPPKWLTGETARQIAVYYFSVNILFIIYSTVMVAIGRMYPMNYLRFFIAFIVPFRLPQLISVNLPAFVIHFGYRIYSMMLTSVVVGSVLGIIFKPRVWCGFCPIQTLTSKKKPQKPLT